MGTEALDLDQRYEEARARRAAKQNDDASKRAAARKLEYLEKVAPLLDETPELHEHEVEAGGIDVSGWVLFRAPTRQEYARWREHKFAIGPERGALTRRANCDRELAAACVQYPDEKGWAELVGRFPAVTDAVAAKVLRVAEAAAEEEGKG